MMLPTKRISEPQDKKQGARAPEIKNKTGKVPEHSLLNHMILRGRVRQEDLFVSSFLKAKARHIDLFGTSFLKACSLKCLCNKVRTNNITVLRVCARGSY